jgi:hypothetical protein
MNRLIGVASVPLSAHPLGGGVVGSKTELPIVNTIGMMTTLMVEPERVDANGLDPTIVPVRGFFSLSFVTLIEYDDNGIVEPAFAARTAESAVPPVHGLDSCLRMGSWPTAFPFCDVLLGANAKRVVTAMTSETVNLRCANVRAKTLRDECVISECFELECVGFMRFLRCEMLPLV